MSFLVVAVDFLTYLMTSKLESVFKRFVMQDRLHKAMFDDGTILDNSNINFEYFLSAS